MSTLNPQGENPTDCTEFKTPSVDNTVQEVVRKARSLAVSPDDRLHAETEHMGEVSSTSLSALLFMADTCSFRHWPAESRGEDFEQGVLDVFLEYRPVTVEEGDVYIGFDIKADPETLEIRRLSVHTAYTAETKRRLVQEGKIEL